jgi:AmmeMemoRadiSam system protein B
MSTRKPAVAGAFYPGEGDELRQMIGSFLGECKKAKIKGEGGEAGNVRAIIVPHAGYVYSGIVAAAGYSLLQGKNFERVVLLGPSHFVRFDGAAFDSSQAWQTPLGEVKVGNFPSEKIGSIWQAHAREHSIEVQLPFLQSVLKGFEICPICIGSYDNISDEIIGNLRKAFLVVSSDLSHYLPYEMAVKKDSETIGKILRLEHVGYDDACGADGISIMIDIARKLRWKPMLLDYRNSGDTAGTKDEVVGYASIAFVEE